VVDRDTAAALRQVILRMNQKQAPALMQFLWMPDHRYVAELGVDDDASVGVLLEQIATDPLLGPALASIMGPNPALIEFNAITSEYGAQHQALHSDGNTYASPMNYARSFGPSHVLLMQLQDTTVGMGATQVCPGTHFCTEGTYDEDCLTGGAISVPTYAGDAMLMTANSWHRGTAFTDQSQRHVHRVMIAMTFFPQPLARAETRRPSQGLSFSMKWYMWGHTLRDLAVAAGGRSRSTTTQSRLEDSTNWTTATISVQEQTDSTNQHRQSSISQRPWSDLRALGLYHGPVVGSNNQKHNSFSTVTSAHAVANKNWGFDYTTLQLIRYAAGATNVGVYDEFGVYDFVQNGGFSPWLPLALHARVPPYPENYRMDDAELHPAHTWHGFYVLTAERCLVTACVCHALFLAVYLLGLHFCLSKQSTLTQTSTANARPQHQRHQQQECGGGGGMSIVVLRLVLWHFVVCWMAQRVNRFIDESPWARDIAKGHHYNVVFPEAQNTKHSIGLEEDVHGYGLYDGPTVYPYKTDVLIETRMGSRHLAMYNDFIEYHPGNRFWRHMLSQQAIFFVMYNRVGGLPPAFAEAVVRNVVDTTQDQLGSRFLYQDMHTGDWMLLSRENVMKVTRRELHASYPRVLCPLVTEVRFFLSECLYGHLRDTALCRVHAPAFLKRIRKSLIYGLVPVKPPHSLESSSLLPPLLDNSTIRRLFRSHSRIRAVHKAMDPEQSGRSGWKRRRNPLLHRDEDDDDNDNGGRSTVTSEPYPPGLSSLIEGDFVEASDGGWYPARLLRVTAHGVFDIYFVDGSNEFASVDHSEIRPFVPYTRKLGDEKEEAGGDTRVQFWSNDKDAYISCQALEWNKEEDAYKILLLEEGEIVENVDSTQLRRYY
jgi:hypothetical protein